MATNDNKFAHPMDFFRALNSDWEHNWPAYLVTMGIILDHRFPADGIAWAKQNQYEFFMPLISQTITAGLHPAHTSINKLRFVAYCGHIDDETFCIWKPSP